MGCRRVPGPVLALLLLLCPSPSPACPAACRCSPPEVDCRERGLRDVPWSLSPNTSTLWLGYNFITVLGPRSFPLLPGLRLLSLVHNRLELIHSRALLGLGALRELDLSHNHLTELTPDTFLPLTSLATLNLGSNRLGELEPGPWMPCPSSKRFSCRTTPGCAAAASCPSGAGLATTGKKCEVSDRRAVSPSPPAHSMLAGHLARAEAGTRHPGCQLAEGLGGQRPREKSLLLCRVPEQLNKYPIMAFGDESFRQCQETSLSPQNYVVFFIIGPFSFIASIFFCTFIGSLVVFYHSLRRESHCWRRPRICRVH
ncbi:hypothetical protein DUI87_30255 [Hirundo rustica rustica]|uniref:LRRNT domain-containing protein n=1 Tax=Hirundo rustica rustica TaxID=333673 RepID=A0A3M0JFU9_HIRRU|nr:hypothetical protein DUI87_30255 [Hirundo rustica rustica]